MLVWPTLCCNTNFPNQHHTIAAASVPSWKCRK